MKLYRSSGAPINPEHKELYHTALNRRMDQLEEKLGRCNPDNAKMFQDKMEVIHRELTVDYPNIGKVEYPKTVKAMKELTNKYGSVAFCIEDEKLVCYILDA